MDQSTAPAGCLSLITPLAVGPPTNANGDGDFCDAGDGPFPEGQPLGNLPVAFGLARVHVRGAARSRARKRRLQRRRRPRRHRRLLDLRRLRLRAAARGLHGYWKQKQHFKSWPAGYTPSQSVESVFDAPAFPKLGANSLLTALGYDGGTTLTEAAKILLRAGVAAVLNSAKPGLNYPRTTADIISQVNAALASNSRTTILALASTLDSLNNLYCPLT